MSEKLYEVESPDGCPLSGEDNSGSKCNVTGKKCDQYLGTWPVGCPLIEDVVVTVKKLKETSHE